MFAQPYLKEQPVPQAFAVPGDFTEAVSNLSPLGAQATSGNGVLVSFSPAVEQKMHKKYSIVPIQVSVPYVTPNVGDSSINIPGFPNGNNRISFKFGPAAYLDCLIDEGLYGFEDLAFALNVWAASATEHPDGPWISDPVNAPCFYINAVQSTQKLIVTISPTTFLADADGSGNAAGEFPTDGILMNFVNPSPVSGLNDSIGELMGFLTNDAAYPAGGIVTMGSTASTVSDSVLANNSADMAFTTEYVLYTDLVTGSYTDGKSGGAMLRIPLGNQTPNSIIAIQFPFRRYMKNEPQQSISTARFWWTDQNGLKLPSFGSEGWSVSFDIEEWT